MLGAWDTAVTKIHRTLSPPILSPHTPPSPHTVTPSPHTPPTFAELIFQQRHAGSVQLPSSATPHV